MAGALAVLALLRTATGRPLPLCASMVVPLGGQGMSATRSGVPIGRPLRPTDVAAISASFGYWPISQ